MGVNAENWTLGAMFDGVYTWSTTESAPTLGGAIDALSKKIGKPQRFDAPGMKYLQVLHDNEISWELLAWDKGVAWKLRDGRFEGAVSTLEGALDQIIECVRVEFGFDPASRRTAR